MPLSGFHPVVAAWFAAHYERPSPPQAEGWPVIARGEHCLILAPTGSGKTLAAFLRCIDQLYRDQVAPDAGVQVLYISPLKALNNDIRRNLQIPLQSIEAMAQQMGCTLPRLTVGLRTGDTSTQERAAMLRRPPHLLITTPESLYLMLTSRTRQILRTVRYIIVDEIHALCSSKRGVHLSLSLERLEALLQTPPVRIGLSATQRPLEEIAHFLGGVGRPVQIIDTGGRKHLDLLVEVPLADMRLLPGNTIWDAIYPRLLELVRQHRSTLLFVNYRGLAERLTGRLNALAGAEIARVHHGSMSREAREQVEIALKEGRLPCLVATSSLELGIDVGAIDLVIQVESPASVARGLQRVGRAGHVVDATSKGRLLPKFRGDLLEMACIVREMRRGAIEESRIPTGALDVLAQQIVAMSVVEEWPVDDLLALIRRSYCYRDLTERQLYAVLDMLAGRYPAEEFRELRPRIIWDREQNHIRGREGARHLAILSGGTIADRGYYGIYIHGTNVKLGEIDEEFGYESTPGDTFLLGTATWRIESIDHDRINVTQVFSATPRMPFWKGDGIGRPYETGLKVGAFVREVETRLGSPSLLNWLQTECALDERAASNLLTYLLDQQEAIGALPTDRQIVVELLWDEVDDRRLVIHSPFGTKVHQAWAFVLKRRLRQLLQIEAEMVVGDEGILLRLPGADATPPLEPLLQIDPDEAQQMLLEEVGNTALFGAYFRMNAGRALLLPKERPGKRRPFWLQRLKAASLLQVARRYGSFPIILETYREVLKEALDTQGLHQVLTGLCSGAIAFHAVESDAPSPMASSILMRFVAPYMYEDDTPRAERRGALLSLNQDLLREVLGEGHLRHLLDRRAIAEVHMRLQHLADGWQPRNADETEDLLRQVGDLTEAELYARGVQQEWLRALAASRRALMLPVGDGDSWIATEDLSLYSAPAAHMVEIIRRFAHARGPFTPAQVADRYGYPLEAVLLALEQLCSDGALCSGEYTPGATGQEYCDIEALRQIHRHTLVLLRREIEPVDGAAFARFLAAWQGVTSHQEPSVARAGASQALRRVLTKLAGAALPPEVWEREILPVRIPGYQPIWLDQLCATGEMHWLFMAGGRLTLCPPDKIGCLAGRTGTVQGEISPTQARIREVLCTSGADFLGGIARQVGLTAGEVLESLWEMARTGLVTNDTFTPVRHLLRAGRSQGKRGTTRPNSGATGRWSIVERLLPAPLQAEEIAEAHALLLLERYGVVAREALQVEEWAISWPDLLRSLQRMEMRGRVRRGHFVQSLSGAQFALPDAVERLRAVRDTRDEQFLLLSVCDPANPWGSILPWPEGIRLARLPANHLILANGQPILAIEGRGRRLSPLPEVADDLLHRSLPCLCSLAASAGKGGRVEVEIWNDQPIHQSPWSAALQAVGFERAPGKLIYYRS